MTFLWQRLTSIAGTLLAVSFAVFLLIDLAPGDYFTEARLDPQMSPRTLDRPPFAERYLNWAKSVAKGEGGRSIAYGLPVADLVRPRLWNTLRIIAPALLLAWLVGMALGFLAASGRAPWLDWIASSLLAFPDLLLAIAMAWLFFKLGLYRSESPLLPITVLSLVLLPAIFRHARSAAAAVLREPYVVLARFHGVAEPRIWFRHVLPATANPLSTLLGLSWGAAFSSSLLIETIAGWPGLGPLLLDAIVARDLSLSAMGILLAAAVVLAGNLLGDLLLLAVDPRIRTEPR